MKKYLDWLKYEDKALKILKKYGLNKSLAKSLIHPYHYRLEEIHSAQAFGIHKKTVERYYKIFGQMLESEYSHVFIYLLKKEKSILQ